ncbi:homeobox protein DBX1 [Caerostris darwini]|uniref:Homeobox protein DBX1 n=1 Tax=Caerostris darwini TaxID=1538125 RepID=A0AAV4PUD9_9ARAC|nr:homeobox protein DBX1 [Caerostris darwini]
MIFVPGPNSTLGGVTVGFNGLGIPTSGVTFPLPATFPWAAAARGKPRRGMMRRAVFSDAQRQGLEKRFQIQKYISKPDRKKLAEKLGLKDSQIRGHPKSIQVHYDENRERIRSFLGGPIHRLATQLNPAHTQAPLMNWHFIRKSPIGINIRVITLPPARYRFAWCRARTNVVLRGLIPRIVGIIMPLDYHRSGGFDGL